MRAHLTEIAVRALKPTDKQFKVWDTTTPGFGVLVNGRSKSWIVMHGRERKLKTLGRYPDLPLAKARQQAKRFLLNPATPRSLTFEDALEVFIETHLSQNKPSTAKETERLLRRHFLPPFSRKAIESITTHDFNAVVDDLPTPSSLAHAFTAGRTFFRWAVRRRLIPHSPVEGLPTPKLSPSRDRILIDDELKQVWTTAEQAGQFGVIVKLLILTGQRRGEIAALHAEWISEDRITLPSWLTKNNREHTFPISPLACSLLTTGENSTGFVFPARGRNAPFNGWSKSKRTLDKLSGVTDWTLHDLRRTFATGLASLGTPIHVTEKILNHISGTTGGLVAVYQRHQFWDEQVAAMNAWENKLNALFSSHV